MPSLLKRAKDAWKVLNGYHLTEWTPDRQFWVRQSQSAVKDIPYGVRRKMLSWAREMERRDPIFNAFLDLCERYVVGPNGLRIVSGSSDARYAALSDAEWDSWQPYCDISSRFSFGQRQGLIEREVEVAGEVFVYLTFGSSARPRIQLIESESVETPPDKANDKSITDGVRFDGNGRPISYFAKDNDGNFHELDADSVVHIFEPSRVGQPRGLSIVYPVLDGMIDLSESLELEMIAQKDASQLSRWIKTETGEAPASAFQRRLKSAANTQANGQATTTAREEFLQEKSGAKTILLKTTEEAGQFKNERPSETVQKFWDLVSARNAAGLGLPIEIMIMRSLQGTMTRAALDMANAFFRCRAASRAEHFGRIREHVVFNSVNLRKIQPADWRKIRYTPPRSINVDIGRNSNALIAEWQAGLRTLEDIAAELGKDWRDILRQRAIEFDYARQLEGDFNLTPGTIVETNTNTNEPAGLPASARYRLPIAARNQL